MEKRRRARINESLGQLKTLILDALKKDVSKNSIFHSASFLHVKWFFVCFECTLNKNSTCPVSSHRAPGTPSWRKQTSWRWQWNTWGTCSACRWAVSLSDALKIKVNPATICRWNLSATNVSLISGTSLSLPPAALSADATVLSKYRAGFNECTNEVTRFLSTSEGVNTEVRSRLLNHLSSCMGQMMSMNYPQQVPSQQAHLAQPLHVQLPSTLPISGVSMGSKLSPVEAISPKVFGGFQLVPASDGQFAFLIPNPAFASATAPVIPLYANAGVPVAVNASPVHGSSATTAASPVHGMTSFSGGSQAVSPVGLSTGSESNEPVWRPW